MARAQGVLFELHIVAGHPVPSIVEFVQRGGYDLLVVGYMGHSAQIELSAARRIGGRVCALQSDDREVSATRVPARGHIPADATHSRREDDVSPGASLVAEVS